MLSSYKVSQCHVWVPVFFVYPVQEHRMFSCLESSRLCVFINFDLIISLYINKPNEESPTVILEYLLHLEIWKQWKLPKSLRP
jgi:hypothetical protein